MLQTALSYEYINSFATEELYELEELCIATQDTASLQRIARVREWRQPSNRSVVRTTRPARPVYALETAEGEPIEGVEETALVDVWSNHYSR